MGKITKTFYVCDNCGKEVEENNKIELRTWVNFEDRTFCDGKCLLNMTTTVLVDEECGSTAAVKTVTVKKVPVSGRKRGPKRGSKNRIRADRREAEQYTDEQREAVAAAVLEGKNVVATAKAVGLTPSQVFNVLRSSKIKAPKNFFMSLRDEATKEAARKLLLEGMPLGDVVDTTGCSYNSIYALANSLGV